LQNLEKYAELGLKILEKRRTEPGQGCEICGVLEQITREHKNSREWRVLQEKAQRKPRITIHVGDKVMGDSMQSNQPGHTEEQ
jgi:hypothetical protein